MVYIFLFAVINLGLGFALAVGLARWQRHATETPWQSGMGLWTLPETPPAERPPETSGVETSSDRELFIADDPAGTPDADMSPAATSPAATTPSDSVSASVREPGIEGEHAAKGGSTVQEMVVLTATQSAFEQSIIELQNWAEQYDGRIVEIDGRLHDLASPADPVVLESYLDSLRQTNEELVKSRDGLTAKLEEASQEKEDFQAFCRRTQEAMRQQNTQIHQTDEILAALDCKARPEEGKKQLIAEATKLLGANNHLRDVLEETRTELARTEQRDVPAEVSTVKDRLTEVPNRATLEAQLAGFWQRDPHRVRHLSMALVDLDQFARVNEHYGHHLGNRILRTVAQVINGLCSDGMVVGRFSGQRFLIVMPDSDLRSATNTIERVRQTVEITRMQHQDLDIRVTMSCGVVGATSQDTLEGLFARAEATLQEAKRYGRNRSFVHEGRYPTPVVPPNFTLGEKTISL